MTPKEAIECLKNEKLCILIADKNECTRECSKCDLVMETDTLLTAYNMAIEALENEKQIPKKVKKEILTSNAFTQWRKYNCPNCGCFLYSSASKPFSAQSHCHQCGQALDWGDDE